MARLKGKRLPTFAGLVAAVLLAALGVGVSQFVRPAFDEAYTLPWLEPVAGGMGLIVGWFFTGPTLQRRPSGVVAIGLTSSVLQALLVLLTFSVVLMLERALRKSYDTVMEAVAGVFAAAIDYGEKTVGVEVIVATLVGGVVVAAVTAWVARRTR